MIERLYRMIYRPHPRGQPQPLWCVSRELGVVEDGLDAHFGRHEPSLHSICFSVSAAGGAFCGTEGGGYGEMRQVVTCFLVCAERDGFRSVDGRAAAHGDDSVDIGVFRNEVCRSVYICDSAVLFYLRKCPGMMCSQKCF